MKSGLIVTLLVATAIFVSAELSFPRADYHGGYEVYVENVDASTIKVRSELRQFMSNDTSPLKDEANRIYIPLGNATSTDMQKILQVVKSPSIWFDTPIEGEGFYICPLETRELGGFKVYILVDYYFRIYAMI